MQTSDSSTMRRSKAIFPDESSDDDMRQEVGPHAPGGSESSSPSSDDDDDDGHVSALPLSSVPVAELDSAETATGGADANATDADGEAAIGVEAEVDSDVDEVLAAASGSETTTEITELSTTDAVVAEAGSKRKRDDNGGGEADREDEKHDVLNDIDADVQPLRLKKVCRSKAAATSQGASGPIVTRPSRTEASPSFASPSSMLSPMKDDSKRRHTPRKSRLSKKPQNLQARMGATELTEKQVVKMIAKLYEEQEQDDRDMYDILTQTVKEQTQCELSDVVDELDVMEFRRMLTYGEVSVESVSTTILPFLKLQADDIFYDLGCGSGKIVIQAVLQTPCAVAKGIELMQNRVQKGADAVDRLDAMKLPVMEGKRVHIVQGDICKPPEVANMRDATVVFINNVCFGPELMLRVIQMLTFMPNLRRVVTLRKFCVRHRPQKCSRARSLCVDYVHPPEEAEILVSWASKTSVYLYERVDYAVQQLAAQLQIPIAVASQVASMSQEST